MEKKKSSKSNNNGYTFIGANKFKQYPPHESVGKMDYIVSGDEQIQVLKDDLVSMKWDRQSSILVD